jgi:hypothetical protein
MMRALAVVSAKVFRVFFFCQSRSSIDLSTKRGHWCDTIEVAEEITMWP